MTGIASNVDVQAEIAQLEADLMVNVAEAFPFAPVAGITEIDTDDDGDINALVIMNDGSLFTMIMGEDDNPILQRVIQPLSDAGDGEEEEKAEEKGGAKV